MMNRNLLRISLDVLMFVLLVLLYEDRVISLRFHEMVGLGIFGLFIIHKGINWKWIAGVTKRLFVRSLPGKTRVGYIVDVLLVIAMVFIVVSGIMISRTILLQVYGTTPMWRFGHFFASALALLLVGVHAGLHWPFIRSMFTRYVKLPPTFGRPVGVGCLVAVVCFGVYSLVTSSFLYWLVGPLILRGRLSSERAFSLFGDAGLTGSALEVFLTFGSIVALTAVETVLVERVVRK